MASACSVRPGSLLVFQTGATTLACAALSLALTVIAFMRRLPAARGWCLALFVLHPAWTMIGLCCDCGTSQMGAAVLASIVSLSVFNWDMLRRRNG